MNPNEIVDNTDVVADNTADTNELEVVLDDTTTEADTEQGEDKDKIIQTLSAQKAHFKKKYEELAKKAIETVEKPKVVEAPKVENSNDIIVARLEARGYIDTDEQDIIVKASKVLGVNPVDAIKDELVLAQIERIRNNKKTQAAVPDSRGRAEGSKKDVNYYISKGLIPEDDEMFNKVIEAQRIKDREGRINRR